MLIDVKLLFTPGSSTTQPHAEMTVNGVQVFGEYEQHLKPHERAITAAILEAHAKALGNYVEHLKR
jgi:hypothetical protein